MSHEYLVEATKSPLYWNSRTIEHPYLVIRAILELHAPIHEIFEDDEGGIIEADWCNYCDSIEYPCRTIEVLKAELNA